MTFDKNIWQQGYYSEKVTQSEYNETKSESQRLVTTGIKKKNFFSITEIIYLKKK